MASRLPFVSLAPFLAMIIPATVQAEPPVYLWGFQRGCERLPEIDRLVEKEMFAQGKRVALLSAPAGQPPLPPCHGEKCGLAFRLACPMATGWLLGGQAVQDKKVTKSRLWLYDLATGQVAYQDDYCQTCTLIAALPVQARQLIDHPQFGSAPDAKPLYCAQPVAQPGPSGPIFLTVYGEGKQKPALQAALKGQLEALGRTVLPVTTELKSYGRDVLQGIVKEQQNARVLMADTQKDGKVAVYLFDQKTAITEGKTVSCTDCERDSLISQVKETAVELLDRCFGVQCARDATTPPSDEACEPFPLEHCSSLDALMKTPPSGSGNETVIDPLTAKIIKGLTWGAFVASTVTSVGLFATDATDAGTSVDPGDPTRMIRHQFNYPAWTAAGLSVLMLGVAIPATIVVNRASRPRVKPATGSPTSSVIQCPSF